MWPSTVYELLLTWGVGFAGQLVHMGWFALLLLVKFKPPSWFYVIIYSWSGDPDWGWEHSVKVWWVTRLKFEVSRPLFSLVIVAGDMILLVVGKKSLAGMIVRKLVKRGLWSRLPIYQNNIPTSTVSSLMKQLSTVFEIFPSFLAKLKHTLV